ncbi:MAG: ATP-binding protein [Tumebacillaceae bacterium]
MMTGYANGWEHLADELRALDMRIRYLLIRRQEAMPQQDDPMDPFKGLVVSEQEVMRLLQEPDGAFDDLSDDNPFWEQLRAEWEEAERRIAERVEQSRRDGVFLPLVQAAEAFGLTPQESRCLVVCLAVETERKYEKIYAYLQDDVTAKHPTVDLVLALLCHDPQELWAGHRMFAPSSALATYLFKRGEEANGTLLTRPLRLDERMTRFFLHGAWEDEESRRFAERIDLSPELPPLLWEESVQERLRRYVEGREEERQFFFIKGNSGSGKRLHVQHLCRSLGIRLVVVDLQSALRDERGLDACLLRAAREAKLHRAALCIRHLHLLAEDKQALALLDAVERHEGLTFLLSEKGWQFRELTRFTSMIEIELKPPSDLVRTAIWERWSADHAFADGIDWRGMASKFRFTIGQMQRALDTAANLARWQGEAGAPIDLDTLHHALYKQVQHNLDKKATRISPKQSFEQLILPREQKEQLRNACNQMKYRSVVFGEWGFERKLSYGKGLSMLFAGPPGTGKTMAAEVIAKELGLEIYKIDLSQVISKYIGETEKNLQEIFTEAQLSSAILFFDEADAIFGKRAEVKDSHDKYANVETAYLLQKMEEYEGITILATNYQQNIDEAFMRRLNYVIKFPFPDAEHREQIWRGAFPTETPLAPDVDFPYLADKFPFAGGNIKNIVMSAAFMGAESGRSVGMRHVIRAVKHELEKNGKLLLKQELADFQEYLNEER